MSASLQRLVPTLPDPHEPLDMNGWPWLNVLALVVTCGSLLFWAYAVLSVRP